MAFRLTLKDSRSSVYRIRRLVGRDKRAVNSWAQRLNAKALHDPALRLRHKIDDLIPFNRRGKFGLDDIQCLGNIVFFEENDAVYLLYLIDGCRGMCPAAQSNRIDTDIR